MLLFLLRTQREAQNTKPTSEDLGGLKEVELTVRKEKKAEMKYSARNNRYITALIYRKNNFSRKEYTKKKDVIDLFGFDVAAPEVDLQGFQRDRQALRQRASAVLPAGSPSNPWDTVHHRPSLGERTQHDE